MGGFPSLPKGTPLFSYDCLDSTNSEALRLIASGDAYDGAVVVADRQSAGRGRRGAVWESPPGNLYLTLVTQVSDRYAAGQLAYVASLAVRDAVTKLTGETSELSCKWPNDLLLKRKKLSGILIEALHEFYVVGIGINISSVSPRVADKAISLADIDLTIEAPDLLAHTLSAFQHWNSTWRVSGFLPVRKAWLDVAYGIGNPIIARFPDGTDEQGNFQGIDGKGALVLERDNGSTRTIAAAEIFFLD
ncbi:MAG: biotin--[acetyl-CoA-carboxylase] ligase [Alphaproteobacteria bacterium]|nr:biotin--[acetyl-CoA-carboxylase] ligase [Alphaproteobacteria bacterium]